MRPHTRRGWLRVWSFSCALALALSAAALRSGRYAQTQQLRTLRVCQCALSALTARVDALTAALERADYLRGGDARAAAAEDVARAAEGVRLSLDGLPLPAEDTALLRQVLASLPARVAEGGDLPPLTAALRRVRAALLDAAEAAASPAFWETPSPAVFGGEDGGVPTLTALFASLRQPLAAALPEESPALPLFLEEREFFSRAAAAGIVVQALGGADSSGAAGWEVAEDLDGELSCYRFRSGGRQALVTKTGGILRSLSDARQPGAPTLTGEQAIASAALWLKRQGYAADMPLRLIGAADAPGCLRLRFVPVQTASFGEVLLLPDALLLAVALDDGTPLLFEGERYLRRHTARTLTPPALTPEDAAAALSPRLTPTGAAVPVLTDAERLCYALPCADASGRAVTVYVDAGSGAEVGVEVETGY